MTHDADPFGDASRVPRGDHDAMNDLVDLLLSRAVAGDAEAHAEILRRAETTPAILVELAAWQADELRLSRAAREIHAIADDVAVPTRRSNTRARAGIGWAVAALIALAWFGRSLVSPRGGEPTSVENRAGFVGFPSADAAFDAYVDRARADGLIFGEVAPPMLVATRELPPSDGGGLEVVVVRQVIERRRLPAIYQLAPADESGQLVPIPVRPWTEHVR